MPEPESNHEFEALLEFLKAQRGFDFTGYKRTTLQRRVARRMDKVRASSYGDYLEHLEVSPGEFTELFNTILINVTGFFRDTATWEYLRAEIVPKLLSQKNDTEDIRIWSAGCASGQEAYSIAALLVEALGQEAFLERVKVYATDIDEDALNEARHASYPAQAIEEVPDDLRPRAFELHDHQYVFRRDLRRALIFGRNDLVQDAPISRIDLLLCRNTLIYFTAETQARILSRLNFALRPNGYLLLGKSEMLLTHGNLFRPVHLKHRVFSKVARPTMRERLAFIGNGEGPATDSYERLRDGAFDLTPVPQIVVDRAGTLAAANQQARALFGLGFADVGRAFSELEVSYRPIELRAAIEQAYKDRSPVELGDVTWKRAGGERRLRAVVTPLPDNDAGLLGAAIAFQDLTQELQLRDELQRSRRELEVAYEELQSTVEELETTNEELQSTNEELETMNDELRERTAELNDVNASLETILTSLGVGIAVVDPQQVIRVWNGHADELWGLRQEEVVGQHFFGLDIGLPVDELRTALREALQGEIPGAVTVPATNRRGQSIECKVTVVPLAADGHEVRGAIVLMEVMTAS